MKPLFTLCLCIALMACSPANEQDKASAPTGANAVNVPAGAYVLDKSHASLLFRVNHMGFSNYTARFSRFDAQLKFDPANMSASSVEVSIDPASLTLDNPPSGFTEQLLGAQWLDAAQYPQMKFHSSKVEVAAPNTLHITGELTLHGVTKPMVLDAIFNGGYAGQAMDPHARIGFSAQGTLKRSDFGVALGIPQPGSTMGVSDDVDIVIEAEFSGPSLAVAANSSSAS